MVEENKKDESKFYLKTMEEVMHESMIPYSEHVILERALPRVEDGLKPVQRRILYTMLQLGTLPDKPYRKSARIVGDCLGKYHPHGDKSVYDAMVRMAQPFNMRYLLVDGHGNFGSIDGDSAAASRYTEARLAPLAVELLRDINSNTVNWILNFDDTLKEPVTLPGRFPNLLVNGSSGIAVGLATNIPPHNLAEVIDGVVAHIDNPRITLSEMMKKIKGPDFPSGAYLSKKELKEAYETGKGKLTIYSKMHIENLPNDKKAIVIDELPYQVNKATLLESIMKLREIKKEALGCISEITDESDRSGMRAVIKLKKEADTEKVINLLNKHTQLSITFGVNMVAIADGKPQQLGLLQIIDYYVKYQKLVVTRRTKFELDNAKRREHILEGLVIAVKNIDEVVRIIKKSDNVTTARINLRKRFQLSEIQAQAILDMRLARLTHLEIYKLEKELNDIRELIKRLEAILASKKLLNELIKVEILQIKKNYKDGRKTQIIDNESQIKILTSEENLQNENYVICLDVDGNIKKLQAKDFSQAAKAYMEKSTSKDFNLDIIKTNGSNLIYCFSENGNCYKLSISDIPECKWREAGSKVSDLIQADKAEKIIKIISIGDTMPKNNLLFYTKYGMVKKSSWNDYKVAKESFQAIKFKNEDDLVINIEEEKPNSTLFFLTKFGYCINADMSDIPIQGRISLGVRGINLNENDYCIFVKQVYRDTSLYIFTDSAYGKIINLKQFEVMSRYRKGIKVTEFDKKAKSIVFAEIHEGTETLQLNFEDGSKISINSSDLPKLSKSGVGAKLSKNNLKLEKVYLYKNKLK